MTVKELKEILDGCNDDASVITHTIHSDTMLRDHQVYHEHNWPGARTTVVVIDLDGTYEQSQGKSQQMKEYAEAHGIPTVEIKLSGAYPSFTEFVREWTMKKDGE